MNDVKAKVPKANFQKVVITLPRPEVGMVISCWQTYKGSNFEKKYKVSSVEFDGNGAVVTAFVVDEFGTLCNYPLHIINGAWGCNLELSREEWTFP